jgi:hypothetical protein
MSEGGLDLTGSGANDCRTIVNTVTKRRLPKRRRNSWLREELSAFQEVYMHRIGTVVAVAMSPDEHPVLGSRQTPNCA